MKVGGILNQIEDYTFWRLAHFFVVDLEYRLINISKSQKELWLEKTENKQAPVIRLVQHNLDWGNWLQQDLERTGLNGENIRKQIIRGNLNVTNIYVTAYPPVDDYEFRIEKPYIHPNQKTSVTSTIIERATTEEQTAKISAYFGKPLEIAQPTENELEGIELLKTETIEAAVNRVKKERALFDNGKPFFTYLFVAVQVIVFLVMELMGSSTDTKTLIQFGAKFNPLILEGEWWRFLTPIFLHIGFAHLLMNTLALFYIGVAVERIFGRWRFFFIYIVAGFGGSLASFLFSPNLSAGASGAIFGCFGALLYFGMIYPKLFFRTMGINIFVVLALNLVFGYTVPGIDNAGHLGGLVGGFLATGIVHFPKMKKVFLQSIFLICTIALSYGILHYGFENPSAVLDETSVMVMSQEHMEKEDFEQAYELLLKIPKDEGLSAQYYFLLSYAEIKLEKLDLARESLLKAIEADPKMHEAHYNLALVYLDGEEIEKAKEHVEKAVELNPNNQDYVNLLNQFN